MRTIRIGSRLARDGIHRGEQTRGDGGYVGVAAQQTVVDLELEIAPAVAAAVLAGAEDQAVETGIRLVHAHAEPRSGERTRKTVRELVERIEQHPDVERTCAPVQLGREGMHAEQQGRRMA